MIVHMHILRGRCQICSYLKKGGRGISVSQSDAWASGICMSWRCGGTVAQSWRSIPGVEVVSHGNLADCQRLALSVISLGVVILLRPSKTMLWICYRLHVRGSVQSADDVHHQGGGWELLRLFPTTLDAGDIGT